MKLSKPLLQALALGVALGGGACSLLQDEIEIQSDTCTEQEIVPNGVDKTGHLYNCPACGMG
ncbi:MAG TPA: hypothetical protein PKA00_21575 [Saprospiraceae bacterium]|nr:hypothetical protein [Saprospiraceae bacterium]HMQ85516.1 hypothetical protein [Saprospiraceae bacterium]